ncbi:hypothetical protein F5883DRAFT_650401 [Diaporthe sp. PMI_573]|nr:hypothetical protein F5883DRAFT_650401 [Diaporthaceae sp. PMI_573]
MSTNIKKLEWDFNCFFRMEYPEKSNTKPGGFRRTSGPRQTDIPSWYRKAKALHVLSCLLKLQ